MTKTIKFMLLGVLALGISCSKKTEDPKSAVDIQKVLENQTVYPHSADFKTTREHGQRFVNNSRDCSACHNISDNLSKVASAGAKGATACISCHKVYPHSDFFKKANEHGKKYIEDRKTCSVCHNEKEPQPKAIGATSCVTCHKDYPHDSDFKKSNSHGTKFYDNPKQCTTCHKDYVEGQKVEATACVSCHKVYPHDINFTSTKAHGTKYLENKFECGKCHKSENANNANAPKNCNTCHSGFPHTEPFKSTFAHGAEFLKDRTSCGKCHGADLKGGDLKLACSKCHNYPHEPSWALAKNHGSVYVAGQGAMKAPCSTCHSDSAKFKERNPDKFVSCGTCHIAVPHPGGDAFLFGEHADTAKKYSGKCFICHSDGKRLMPNMAADGGCFQCHQTGKTPTVSFPMSGSSKTKESVIEKYCKKEQSRTTASTTKPSKMREMCEKLKKEKNKQ